MKVQIYKHDPMLNFIRNEEECKDLFGQDYFNEDWSDTAEIEESLYNEWKEAKEKLYKLNEQLEQILIKQT